MKIIFDELPNENCKIAFIRAVMATAGAEAKPKPYELVFTIDGLPVDWEKFCESYEVHIEHYVNQKVEERIADLVNLRKWEETVEKCSEMLKMNCRDFLIKSGLTESQADNVIHGEN